LTPEDMMNIVLKDLEPSILDKIDVAFECDCSKERVAEVFVAIGRDELKAIIEEDKRAEVGCQFCESKYSFSEEELKEIYDNM
jgi:hsp33 protein